MKVPTIAELAREVRAQRRLLVRLTSALYTHTRTDIAPDAALPQMRKLLDEMKGRKR
jgi:hypothetical protein